MAPIFNTITKFQLGEIFTFVAITSIIDKFGDMRIVDDYAQTREPRCTIVSLAPTAPMTQSPTRAEQIQSAKPQNSTNPSVPRSNLWPEGPAMAPSTNHSALRSNMCPGGRQAPSQVNNLTPRSDLDLGSSWQIDTSKRSARRRRAHSNRLIAAPATNHLALSPHPRLSGKHGSGLRLGGAQAHPHRCTVASPTNHSGPSPRPHPSGPQSTLATLPALRPSLC